MRISDWSSDVCSSDLIIAEGLPPDEKQDRRQRRGRTAEPVDRRNAEEGEEVVEQPVARVEQIAPDDRGRDERRHIGREQGDAPYRPPFQPARVDEHRGEQRKRDDERRAHRGEQPWYPTRLPEERGLPQQPA